jgi:hypothetical protein
MSNFENAGPVLLLFDFGHSMKNAKNNSGMTKIELSKTYSAYHSSLKFVLVVNRQITRNRLTHIYYQTIELSRVGWFDKGSSHHGRIISPPHFSLLLCSSLLLSFGEAKESVKQQSTYSLAHTKPVATVHLV